MKLSIHITRLLDYSKIERIFGPRKLFSGSNSSPEKSLQKNRSIFVSKIGPATGVKATLVKLPAEEPSAVRVILMECILMPVMGIVMKSSVTRMEILLIHLARVLTARSTRCLLWVGVFCLTWRPRPQVCVNCFID